MSDLTPKGRYEGCLGRTISVGASNHDQYAEGSTAMPAVFQRKEPAETPD